MLWELVEQLLRWYWSPGQIVPMSSPPACTQSPAIGAGQKVYSAQQAQAAPQEFAKRWGPRYKHIKKLTERADLHYYFTYLDYDWQVQSMIYTTNWIEQLNKSFRRSTKIRGVLPNPQATLLLLSKVAVDQEDGAFGYLIYNFKFDNDLYPHIDF